MPHKNVLFWFDVEDCTVPQSADAAKRLAQILTQRGVRGTMKLVGQKARVLREQARYDVIDALALHAIGYHTDQHGFRPQPAEYMAPLDWLDGGEEFARRERAGLEDIRELFGQDHVCYGQPGSNWSPQVFPILRRWGIHTYVSSFSYVSLYAQPFWYGGLLNTSRMAGADRRGREVQHLFGLNFELGRPGALDEHKRLFAASCDALEDGGLISIPNHPCTLVLEKFFSTDMKPRELTEAGYQHFDEFLAHAMSREDVRIVTADQLLELYPDLARGRVFGADELLALARGVGEEVEFQETDGMSLSPAELFGMFTQFLAHAVREGSAPAGASCRHFDGPALPTDAAATDARVDASAFATSVVAVESFLRSNERLPDAVEIGDAQVTPADYYVALAEAARRLIEHGAIPGDIGFAPATHRVQEHVSERAAHGGWATDMMPPGFSAPKLLEQARLQAWTLKPALLSGSLA